MRKLSSLSTACYDGLEKSIMLQLLTGSVFDQDLVLKLLIHPTYIVHKYIETKNEVWNTKTKSCLWAMVD